MIRDITLENFRIEEWDDFSQTDRNAKDWIWNQLMGETSKGDALEFMMICRSYERLYAGVLKDAGDKIKAIIPAKYERYCNGILDTVDYAGCTEHDEGENPEYKLKKGHVDIDFEAFAREFLTSKK